MSILVVCQCGQQFLTSDENSGREARCLDCGETITVPPPLSLDEDAALRIEFLGAPPLSGRAIASLVLGVLSLIFSLFAGIPAIALGYLGLLEIRRSRGRIRGAGMAMAGMVLGFVGCSAVTLLYLGIVAFDVRENARKSQCANNLKQIALAMHNYHSAYQSFPPAAITDRTHRPLLSWRVAILPYLGPEGALLYSKFNLSEPWDNPVNYRLLAEMPKVFGCPSDATSSRMKTPYQVLVGKRTMFPGLKSVGFNSVTDGTVHTILVGEADIAVFWTAPQDLPFDLSVPNSGLGSFHGDEFNTAFADGSTRSLKRSIDQGTLGALISRNGGEVIPSGF